MRGGQGWIREPHAFLLPIHWLSKDDAMAKLSNLKLQYRIFMGTYRYRQFDWRPGAVLEKPLSQSHLAVVTTAAFFRPEQAPFNPSIRGGDYSFREISLGTNLDTL